MPSLAIAQAMLVTCWELNWLRTAGTIARWVSTSISLLFVVRSVASAHTNGTRRSGADPRGMHPLPRSHEPFLPLGIVHALVCMGLVVGVGGGASSHPLVLLAEPGGQTGGGGRVFQEGLKHMAER